MSEQAKITSKGQITVPKKVRRALGVEPGDSLIFENHGDEVVVKPVKKKSAFGKYRGIGNPEIGSGRKVLLDYFEQMRGHRPEK